MKPDEIAFLRSRAHHLSAAQLTDPVTLVARMGAVQAQDAGMARWGVGLRLALDAPQAARLIDRALSCGELLRMHVLRPTWHLVPAADAAWMVRLTGERLRMANRAYGNSTELNAVFYDEGVERLRRILAGTSGLTRTELARQLGRGGREPTPFALRRLLVEAEARGVMCSGPDREGEPTYALVEERVSRSVALTDEEALLCLATRYFGSHGPATVDDFAWWSSLPVSTVRKALHLLRGVLEEDDGYYWLPPEAEAKESDAPSGPNGESPSCGGPEAAKPAQALQRVHCLPAWDEYLVAYRDRSAVIAREHVERAYNRYGLFRPVLLCGGRIVGRWIASGAAVTGADEAAYELFAGEAHPARAAIGAAMERYRNFVGACTEVSSASEGTAVVAGTRAEGSAPKRVKCTLP